MSRVEALASAGDLARILDVSRATIYVWQRRDDFPAPVGTVGGAQVWKVSDVVKWERDNPRPVGRPKSTKKRQQKHLGQQGVESSPVPRRSE